MAQYEVRHQCDRKCSDCRFFDYDEWWDKDEEEVYGTLVCMKGHKERVCWGRVNCEDFDPDTDA